MNVHVNFSWTEERELQLVKLVGDGFSASQIAAQIRGVTRNAVIGKVSRLRRRGVNIAFARPKGFNEGANRGRRPKSVTAETDKPLRAPHRGRTFSNARHPQEIEGLYEYGAETHLHAPKPHRPAWCDFPMPADSPAPLNLTLMQLTDKTCKWPVEGEKEHTLFCGLSSVAGRPWCPFHCVRSSGSFQCEGAS